MNVSPITYNSAPNYAPANTDPPAPRAAVVGATQTGSPRDIAASPGAKAIDPAARRANDARLESAVASINKFLKPVASAIEFSIDEQSGRTLVKVIDTATNDVLRQFPSKEALAISQELDKLQGLLLREKA